MVFLRLKLSPPRQLALGGLIVGLLCRYSRPRYGETAIASTRNHFALPPLFSLIGGILRANLAVLASQRVWRAGRRLYANIICRIIIGMFLGRIWDSVPGSDEIAILLGLAGMADAAGGSPCADVMSTLMILLK